MGGGITIEAEMHLLAQSVITMDTILSAEGGRAVKIKQIKA